MKFQVNLRRRKVSMRQKWIKAVLIALMLSPGIVAAAVTDEDFTVKTTQNLLNLCAVSADDPRAKEAIQMCQGYLVGAYDYYVAENSGKDSMRLVCMPNPAPTRNEAVAMFVEWAKANQQYMNDRPVDTEFRFLSAKWPCKK
jgi:Rap1a immunity proteins